MSSANIVYRSDGLLRYFGSHRRYWGDVYPSERWVIQRVASASAGLGRVLDVGCATGGIGHALAGQVSMASYTGTDIHAGAIEAARADPIADLDCDFVVGDIVDCPQLPAAAFDSVLCLSVADWNVRTDAILDHCWRRVAFGGRMIVSLRLTHGQGTRDPKCSFQYILADPSDASKRDPDVERAPYVVFHWADALSVLASLTPRPQSLLGYGYWGRPSASARTPYEQLVFAVFSVSRAHESGTVGEPTMELHLPWTLVDGDEIPK